MLSELLGHEGYETTAISSITEASSVLGRQFYAVVYVDGDAFPLSQLLIFAKQAAPTNTPIVVAGTNRPLLGAEAGLLFIRKPYHYRELVHKMTEAWKAADAQVRAAA